MTLCASDIGSTEPCKARLKMIETMIQPMLSSMMADARITWPTMRRMKFISRTTMATIFTEAIDSAVPRKSEVISRLPGSGSMLSGKTSPSAKPQANGTTMPISDANSDARPVWRTSLRSVSMPVSNSSSRMPNCEIAVDHRLLFGIFRKQRVLHVGKQRAEEGRAEQEAGDQLAHHGGLAQPQHGFAQQPADQHQHDDLGDEDCVGCALAAAFGGPSRPCRQQAGSAWPKPQPRSVVMDPHGAAVLQAA